MMLAWRRDHRTRRGQYTDGLAADLVLFAALLFEPDFIAVVAPVQKFVPR